MSLTQIYKQLEVNRILMLSYFCQSYFHIELFSLLSVTLSEQTCDLFLSHDPQVKILLFRNTLLPLTEKY